MTDDGPAPPRAARSPAAFAAIVGVACGLVGGAAGAWLVARDPGPGAGAPGSLRGDLDRVERESVAARTSVLERVSEILGRLELAEARAAQHGAGADAVALRRVADELRMLAEVTRNDLRAADVRLGEVERRLDSLGALATGAPPDGPPDPDEEARWVNLASDADPLRRFSALVVLGRERTDRSVRASLEALHDPVEVVAWQAARNLGRFGDRTTARDLAPLLDHASAAVRSAAAESLRALGAPIGDYEPAAPAESRRGTAAAVERWASERD